ncbi:MAG: CehA/McbA family metallohydrolase [Acidobacteriota bacterium]
MIARPRWGLLLLLAAGLLQATAGRGQAAAYPPARQGGNYMHNYYIPPAPSSSPWAPCWSPDGLWLAVALHGSIWKVDFGQGAATELTYNSRYHSSPTISPDGRWLVYTADDNHRRIQLEVLNLETGESFPLTNDEHLYLDPTFSPDGSRLAYVSTQPNGYFNIFVRPIRAGRWAGPPASLTEDHNFGRDRLYFGPWDMHIQPAWTRNGEEVVFVSNRGIPLGSGDLWRMPATTGAMKEARPVLREQSLYRTRPDVSPDGRRLIYSSTAGGADQFNHLYVLPISGGAPYKLTFGDHDDFHPRWSPDGEQIAYISNQPAAQSSAPAEAPASLPQLWLLETHGGKKNLVELKKLYWKRPMGKVHVQVKDGKSGRNTAARIYGLASDGKFYAPHTSYSRVGELGEHLFHTDGEFVLVVPAGRMRLEAVKGFERWPAQQEVEVLPGQTVSVTLTLKPFLEFQTKGWISGSTHVHMNYGGNLHNTLANLMLMSKAEDQDVVNELVANKDNRVLDWQFFVSSGGEHPVSAKDPDLVVIVGEEYRPPFYGHTFLIGLRDHLISPFTTGYEGTAIESLYPSNTDIFRKARSQGATVGYVHAFSGEADPLDANLGVARGFPVDAALGAIDAMEWSTSSGAALKVWHHALNNDLRIAAVGGEDSISDLHRGKLVGSLRTYAYSGGRLSAEAWIAALKEGKTFFTSGPLLELKIDNHIPGESLQLPAQGGVVQVEAEAWSITPMKRVVLYQNGRAWKDVPLSGDRLGARFSGSVKLERSAWFSLLAEGPPNSHPLDVNHPQAATSAIRAYVGDQKIRSRGSAEYFIRWIDKLQVMARDWPGWRSQKEREHVLSQFDEARRVYERLAEESGPFLSLPLNE